MAHENKCNKKCRNDFLKKIYLPDINRSLNGEDIPRVIDYKYQGVYLDSTLSCAEQISDVLAKTAKARPPLQVFISSTQLCEYF